MQLALYKNKAKEQGLKSCLFTILQKKLAAGEVSAESLAQNAIKRIDQMEHSLNAIISYNKEITTNAAKAADRRLTLGERGPMLGLPVVFKDNMHWKGLPLSNGSKIMKGYVAPYNATVVQRLLDAGAVPIAKTNMDEFAMGSSGEYSAFGPTRNPWNLDKTPGGSSSGSAVSVAAGYVPFALGSDTGGSVRLPGGFCNVTALRPTYGVLSRYGVTAMASSLDQVGPMGSSAQAVAAGLSVMAGIDKMDSNSVELTALERLINLRPTELKGLRIGLPKEYFTTSIEPGVKSTIESALLELESRGSELVEISLPHTSYAIDTYCLINTAEAYSNLAQFDGVRYGNRQPGNTVSAMIEQTRSYGLGQEVKRRVLLGAFCLSKGNYDAFYIKATKTRSLIAKDFQEAFKCVDVIATPVSPVSTFSLGDKINDPISMYLADIFTVTPSLASLPAISIPAGFVAGMPIGLQLIGRPLDDIKLLELACTFQKITDHHLKTPTS